MKKAPSSTAARKRNTSGKRTKRSSQATQEPLAAPKAFEPTIPALLVNWSVGKPTRYVRVSDSLRPEEDHHKEIEYDLRKQANLTGLLNPTAQQAPLLHTIFAGKPLIKLRRTLLMRSPKPMIA
jgi:hypothetical protein